MKPLRLVMSAFGSYLKQTEIDFEALGDGIFLITGIREPEKPPSLMP